MHDCVEFRGKFFFLCLGVCAKFYFTVFAKVNGGPYHERPWGDCGGHATIYWERIEPKTVFPTMLVVGVSKRVNAINNTFRDGERGEGMFFDAASCAEFEEPVGTLEVSCWSK